MTKHFKGGKLGWIILAGFVVVWDNLAKETLSDAFWRGLASRRWRWPVIGLSAAVVSHLFAKTPLPIKWIP